MLGGEVSQRRATFDADIVQTTISFKISDFFGIAALTQRNDGCMLERDNLVVVESAQQERRMTNLFRL
jgi:hypothetical protein